MRRLVAAVLLCYGPAVLAFDNVGEIVAFQMEEIAIATMEVCITRDPDNASATREALAHWASINREGLDELRTGREKLLKAYKARAATPEPQETLEERREDYDDLRSLLVLATGDAFKNAVKGSSDAGLRETCANTRQYWLKQEPEAQLPSARARLHKMLADVQTSK